MKVFSLVILIFTATSFLFSQKNTSSTHEYERTLEQFISDIALSENFNGSILLYYSDSIAIHKNFGFTSFEKTHLIGDNSYYNIGSIAKTLCSYALLSLMEEGKVSLSDKISIYFPELPEWSAQISVEQLLFYKSGLPQRGYRNKYSDQNLWRELNNLDKLESREYIYSNYNNFLQAKIVEKITGGSLEQYVQKEFFEPLQMSNSIYTKYPTNLENPNITRCFSDIDGDDILNNPYVLNFDLCYAPVYMTINDLYKWSNFIVTNYRPKDELHTYFHQEISYPKSGPLGNLKFNNGKIQSYDFAGQSYKFLIKGYFNETDSTTLILATNKNPNEQLASMKEEIFMQLGIK